MLTVQGPLGVVSHAYVWSVITVVVCPCHLQTMQEGPVPLEVLHEVLLFVGSWEGKLIKWLHAFQSIHSGSCRAGMFPWGLEQQRVVFGCSAPFFGPTPEVTGATGGAHSQAPSGIRPYFPLASDRTAMVHPCCLWIMQEAP